jgi:beta-lactamase class A
LLVIVAVGVCAWLGPAGPAIAGPAGGGAGAAGPGRPGVGPAGVPAAGSAAADRAATRREAARIRMALRTIAGWAEPAGHAAERAARQITDRRARATALTRALSGLAGTFAVAVVNNRTGEVYRHHPTARFQTASVVKLDILAGVLLTAQDAGRGLTATERSLASRMIRASDNAAASSLWWRLGGHDGLARINTRLGLTHTVLGRDTWWGTTTTTVVDQVRMVDIITGRRGPLNRTSVAYAVGLMRAVNADQDWGVSAAARAGERVALKNGWFPGPTSLSEWTVNTVGRITDANTDATVVVLSQGNRSMAAGVALVEAVTRLTRQHLRW